ncbi:hypothetical protein Pint_31838 [Pistacia integerrima]|uniref:Uncharacterized protein n=1 Tax=Pistacia integerrima TaxID=434235 RepID=A0ACC0XNJ2_9ROSI|nr:hypothetical protein Pint_31838 [Pistacia integerrima]
MFKVNYLFIFIF